MTPSSPILVLDSGLGGLNIVQALRAALPHEDILCFADTARIPYGSKSSATIAAFVRQIIAYLQPHQPKHVVLACNTATALALQELRAEFPDLPISGVIEPGAKAAAAAAGARQFPVIGVIATEATIRSKAYERAIHRRRNNVRLLMRATPLLVPIIEEGRKKDDPLVRLALRQYLEPMVRRGMQVLVLGCTHYPILRDNIVEVVGPKVAVIDSAAQCAEDVARRLRMKGMLRKDRDEGGRMNDERGIGPPDSSFILQPSSLSCFVTDNPARFARLALRTLGLAIDPPVLVSIDELHEIGAAPIRQAG